MSTEYYAYMYDDLYHQGKLDDVDEDTDFNLEKIMLDIENEDDSHWDEVIDDQNTN